MRSTLAGSDMAPSAVHAIIEIGLNPGIQARDLGELLYLDKSNTSRQLAKLEALGLVRRTPLEADGRAFSLALTEAGQALRKKIDKFATDQVSAALRRIVPEDQQGLLRALALYSQALSRENPNAAASQEKQPMPLCLGYQPGCIGDIASLHARYYAEAAGFGVFFEHKVGSELGAFAQLLPTAGKQLWTHVEQGRILASIVIDGDPANGVAHLRWFIVDDSLRGAGVGRRLLEQAMAFVDAHGFECYLWTFQGLDAARHLYLAADFGEYIAGDLDRLPTDINTDVGAALKKERDERQFRTALHWFAYEQTGLVTLRYKYDDVKNGRFAADGFKNQELSLTATYRF
jgi:DNA-binding MarR family transcriptional regulator/GNAT superfamily N-acetyltransferase